MTKDDNPETFKESLALSLPAASYIIICNNSDQSAWAKPEDKVPGSGTKPFEIKGRSCTLGLFDGITTPNQEKGKVAKCTDLSMGFVDEQGNVECYGPDPRPGKPWISREEYINSPPDDGWNDTFSKADEIKATPPGGGDAGHGHEHDDTLRTREVFRGDIETGPGVGATA